jgi:hypothetical protein
VIDTNNNSSVIVAWVAIVVIVAVGEFRVDTRAVFTLYNWDGQMVLSADGLF